MNTVKDKIKAVDLKGKTNMQIVLRKLTAIVDLKETVNKMRAERIQELEKQVETLNNALDAQLLTVLTQQEKIKALKKDNRVLINTRDTYREQVCDLRDQLRIERDKWFAHMDKDKDYINEVSGKVSIEQPIVSATKTESV